MIADRPLLGIGFMLGFCVLAPLGDSIAKILGDTVPLGVLLLARFGLQAVILAPVVHLFGAGLAMTPRVLRLTALRTLLHVGAMAAMFTALRFLPLAETVAIAFVMPFIMLLLGRYVLQEEVGPRRLAACAVGFIGTLLVVQPSFAAVGAPALLPLLVAVGFALFMLITRQIAKETDPVALQAVSGLMATPVILAAFILPPFAGSPVFDLVLPTGRDALLLVSIGGIGTIAHLAMTWSLRFAPSATLAPMQYLEIPVATLLGWAIFGDLPNGLAALGIAITVGAGLYIVLRERALSMRPVARLATD
jgi:drug/metabolite transporter (DMT)-like permease